MRLAFWRKTIERRPIDTDRYVITAGPEAFAPVRINSLDGVDWCDAPVPPRLHHCWPQTIGVDYGSSFTEVNRCACGAFRGWRGPFSPGPWLHRNERLRNGTKVYALPLLALAILAGPAACDEPASHTPQATKTSAAAKPSSPPAQQCESVDEYIDPYIAPCTWSPECEITKVVDGDTIKVNCGKTKLTVRVIGIDTPETKAPGKPVQCYGPEATTKAKRLLHSGKVTLTSDPNQGKLDRYGRTLAYVEVDGEDFGRQMILSGHAREYTYRKPYENVGTYRNAEALAKSLKRGLWGKC